jgi:CheY-like chemotaxis protein
MAAPVVLVVDDSPVQRRLVCRVIAESLSWQTAEAGNGVEAMAAIGRSEPDMVLTDLLMPNMDGLELVEEVREKHPLIPVILMTAFGSETLALQALQRGAASYVPKSGLSLTLGGMLERVYAASRMTRERRRLMAFLTRVEMEFTLDNDPSLVPALVSQLQGHFAPLKLCDQNTAIRLGVALEEAVLNGIVHGNLQVDSDLRQEDEAAYTRRIQERRHEPPFRDRRVHVRAALGPDRAEFTIADEGPGFDPSALPDPTDPANLDRVGGRGLLLIRTFMDQVHFNAAGNAITMTKRCGGAAR